MGGQERSRKKKKGRKIRKKKKRKGRRQRGPASLFAPAQGAAAPNTSGALGIRSRRKEAKEASKDRGARDARREGKRGDARKTQRRGREEADGRKMPTLRYPQDVRGNTAHLGKGAR